MKKYVRPEEFISALGVRCSIVYVLLLFFFGCTAQKPVGVYTEDLSANRPRVALVEDTTRRTTEVRPTDGQAVAVARTRNVNEKVDAVLDSIDRFNLTKRFVDGFTAQVYSGQKKEDAMHAKQKMLEDIPDMPAVLEYVQPKFRVTVGHYFTKLEGQKDLVRLLRVFPNAILVPEKIQVR